MGQTLHSKKGTLCGTVVAPLRKECRKLLFPADGNPAKARRLHYEMHNITFPVLAFGLVSEDDHTEKRFKNKAGPDTCLTCAGHTHTTVLHLLYMAVLAISSWASLIINT